MGLPLPPRDVRAEGEREYGYYVLPLLVGDQVVGRAEPRFDRKTKTLECSAPGATRRVLDEALEGLAEWLGAERIEKRNEGSSRGVRNPRDPRRAGPDPATGAVMTPIYQTSTYVQEAAASTRATTTRATANPTRTALEENLAALEGAAHGLASRRASAPRRRS